MAENEDCISADDVSETFYIHFNLPDHQIPLSTFIETANETQAVIRAFNNILFDGKPTFEIYVIPPEEGTFLGKYKVIFIAAALLLGGSWKFIDHDIGKLIIKELTGNEPIYYAQEAIKVIKSFLKNLNLMRTKKIELSAKLVQKY
ncbi:MAG: hypothetical protein L3J83_06930 [Proteobacteria bacterium]|nr:hypothetical protein [Pseudomonadota bacterium]